MKKLNKLKPAYLDIVIDADFVSEDSPNYQLINEQSCRVDWYNNQQDNGPRIRTRVSLAEGRILDWKEEYGRGSLFVKVGERGSYILYDEDMNQLSIIDLGPVPNKLIPEHDGDGRYIDIVISQKGYITNWYNEPSFEEFKF